MTESEAVDIRKKRQEEWEKVRTAADPIGLFNFYDIYLIEYC